MHEGTLTLAGRPVELSRSGYTGGDGFELALPADHAEALVEELLALPGVALAGLAARDSLRLEVGVCLYGHDLDPTTTPVEAGLQWAIPKSRRSADAGFRGAARIAEQLSAGPPRRRVGLQPVGRRPIREGAELHVGGRLVGRVTSGGYSPVLSAPIAMGYLDTGYFDSPTTDNDERELVAVTGGRTEPVRVVPMPFVAKDYHR
jgi:aminomethyltransferase